MSARLRAKREAAEEAARREEAARKEAASIARADSILGSSANSPGVLGEADYHVDDCEGDPLLLIRRMWQLPCSVHFIRAFRQFFNVYMKINEIEAALIDSPDSISLGQIHVALLSSLLSRRDVLLNTWREILYQVRRGAVY